MQRPPGAPSKLTIHQHRNFLHAFAHVCSYNHITLYVSGRYTDNILHEVG